MKSTEKFKQVISNQLKEMAETDPLFAIKFSNEKKNIDDCVTYILNTVKNSGCNGFSDEEIFGMARHYYDESEIEVGSRIGCNVVVNHTIELTEEEKREARQKAIDQAIREEKEKLTKKATAKKPEPVVAQTSLF